jgi:hypothetical protein
MTNVRLLKAASSDAAGLLAQAIKTNDEDLAYLAFDLFTHAIGIATAEQQFNLVQSIVADQVRVYKLKDLVELHRTGKLSEALFKQIVETFRPSYWDLSSIEKSRISIDKILYESHLRGEDPTYSACINLLKELSPHASHQAMASVLRQALDRLSEADEADLHHPTLFHVINRYNKSYNAEKPLPAHLIELINEQEDRFLDLSTRQYPRPTDPISLLFSVPILEQLRAAGNQRLVSHMAIEHGFNDEDDPWALVKAKALGGDIPLERVSALIESFTISSNFSSGIVYALHDDAVAVDFIGFSSLSTNTKYKSVMKAIAIVFDAIPADQPPSQQLLVKTEHLINQFFTLPYRADLIMNDLTDIARLPSNLLLSFPASREQLLCLDLGL